MHGELANGLEIYGRYSMDEVGAYLDYTHRLAIQALRANEVLAVPVSEEWHLRNKGYESNGRQYAQDHGYSELIQGDPHDQRIEKLIDLHADDNLPTFPSTCSHDQTSMGGQCIPTHLFATGLAAGADCNADTSSQSDSRAEEQLMDSASWNDCSNNWDFLIVEDP
ncbi:hypothetical protein PM082_024843 [Marasmius tenuissimus]|nr:hypothetical protein PM082_024843 [Marasmius tenuissimus]